MTATLRIWQSCGGWAWSLTTDFETVAQGGTIKSEKSARNIAMVVARDRGLTVKEAVEVAW